MDEITQFSVKRHELINVANAMLAGDMDLVEGVRQICSLRFSVNDPENRAFLVIRGVESETDVFPVGHIRLNCSKEYLQRMDAEMHSYLREVKDDILQACRDIIQSYTDA